MSSTAIRKELAELRARLERLESQTASPANQRWRQAAGTIKPNALTREAARLGAEWRARENKRR